MFTFESCIMIDLLFWNSTEFSTPADQAWGSLTSNGSWNGMVGMILKNEVEFAVTEFTMTSLRAAVVDFSIPLIDTR